MNSKTYYFHNICNINSADKLTYEAKLELLNLCYQQESTDCIQHGTALYLDEGVNVFIDNDGDVCIIRCGENSIKKGGFINNA